jgi:hypothetical protein
MKNVQQRDLMRRKGKAHIVNPSSEEWHISNDEVEKSGFESADIYIVSCVEALRNVALKEYQRNTGSQITGCHC